MWNVKRNYRFSVISIISVSQLNSLSYPGIEPSSLNHVRRISSFQKDSVKHYRVSIQLTTNILGKYPALEKIEEVGGGRRKGEEETEGTSLACKICLPICSCCTHLL